MPSQAPQNQPNKFQPNAEVLVKAEHFSGPLPHPAIFEHYEKVLPGTAERILKSFENQAEHRQAIEKSVVKTDNFKSIAGLFLGFIVAATAILGGIYCALKGQPFLGGSLSFTSLAILVIAFVTNRFSGNKNQGE